MLKNYQKKVIKISAQILFIILTFIFIYLKPIFIVKVIGDSMEPTLKMNNIVLACNLQKKYSKGDIILAEQDESLVIKRIAFQEKDKFFCLDLGYMRYQPAPVIKSVEYETEYFKKFGIKAYIYEVPEKQVFLLGDNEKVSEDSRVYGSIPIENIKAKIIYY